MSQKGEIPKGMMPKKELLTDEDLMAIFGVSKTSLRRWRDKGHLHFLKFGNRCYYPSKPLKKIIKESFHPYYKNKNKQSALDVENEKTNGEA